MGVVGLAVITEKISGATIIRKKDYVIIVKSQVILKPVVKNWKKRISKEDTIKEITDTMIDLTDRTEVTIIHVIQILREEVKTEIITIDPITTTTIPATTITTETTIITEEKIA